jgi:transcriptional regulator with XRE-family HTH domain
MARPRKPPLLAAEPAYAREAWGKAMGRVLRRWRELSRLTALEVAQRADVDLRQVQRLELGTGNPTLETVTKLAAAMGMAVTTALAEVERDLYRADGKRPPLFLRDGDRKRAAVARAPAAVPMGPAMERLARALKARRAELGLTQTDLATRAQVSRSRVQTIEAMSHAATLDTLDRLAEALDCDVVELLGGRAG